MHRYTAVGEDPTCAGRKYYLRMTALGKTTDKVVYRSILYHGCYIIYSGTNEAKSSCGPVWVEKMGWT